MTVEEAARRAHERGETADVPWENMAPEYRAGLIADVGDRLVTALQDICRVSIPEIGPDGVDQAAYSMRLSAVEALEAVRANVPKRRGSGDDRETVTEWRAVGKRLPHDYEPVVTPWSADRAEVLQHATPLIVECAVSWLERRTVTYGPVERVNLMDGEGRPQPEGESDE